MRLRELINTLFKKYKNVKFIESSDLEIEDHSIYLDEKTHIQVCCDGTYEVVIKNDDNTLTFNTCKSGKDVLKFLGIK